MTCCAGVCTGLCGDRSKIGMDLRTGVLAKGDMRIEALVASQSLDFRDLRRKVHHSRGGSSAKRNAPRQQAPHGGGMETNWFAAQRKKARAARKVAKAAKRKQRK